MKYIYYTDWTKGGKVFFYKASGGASFHETGARRLAIQCGRNSKKEAFEAELLNLLIIDEKYFRYTARMAEYAKLVPDKSTAKLLAGINEVNHERALAELLLMGDKIS